MKRKQNNYIVRQYNPSDEKGVTDLWRNVFPKNPAHNKPEDDIKRKMRVQRELFFVAEINSEIIGTAMAGYDGHRGWVYYVAVSSDKRRKGIGAALMRRVETELKAIGCSKLNLQVREGNEEVVAFYQKLGYHIEPRISMARLLE